MNRQIVIEKPVQVSDGMGGQTTTWTEVAWTWAAIMPVSSRRKIEAMQSGLNLTHDITMRYRSGMHGSYRIRYGTRYFAISGIVDTREAHRFMVLTCTEAAV